MRHGSTLRINGYGTIKVFNGRILKFLAPGRCILGYIVTLDWPFSVLFYCNRAPMNKIQIRVVEVITIVVINRSSKCTCAHVGIILIFIKSGCTGSNLVTVMFSDDTLSSIWIIRGTEVG